MYMANMTGRHLMDGLPTTRIQVNTKTITIQMLKMHAQSGIMYVVLDRVCARHDTDGHQDHTEFETGENVYHGQSGFYILSDDQEKALKLPTGEYDIPLSICAKQYGSDGSLVFDTNGNNGLPGDVIQVYGTQNK